MEKMDRERGKRAGTTHARAGHSGGLRQLESKLFRPSEGVWPQCIQEASLFVMLRSQGRHCPFSLHPKVPRRREKQRLSQPLVLNYVGLAPTRP